MTKVSLGEFIVNPVKLLQEVSGEEALKLTHPGYPAKVIISEELYLKLVGTSTRFSWLEWWR